MSACCCKRNGLWKKTVLFVAIALSATVVWSLIDRISPKDMTITSIDTNFVRIQIYMQEHRKAPPSLHDLPLRPGYADGTKDGWGNELQYSVDQDGVITLTSYGADGKYGGEGHNKDISRRYRTRNPDGSLNIDDKYWNIDAEIR
jgi:hypothetical protein